MPIELSHDHPILLIRRAAFEEQSLTRAMFDERLGLTVDEFRVEGDLVAVGPLPPSADLSAVIEELEAVGLSYFDDFFDLSGTWPPRLKIFAMAARQSEA
jgi:hypothetical protein